MGRWCCNGPKSVVCSLLCIQIHLCLCARLMRELYIFRFQSHDLSLKDRLPHKLNAGNIRRQASQEWCLALNILVQCLYTKHPLVKLMCSTLTPFTLYSFVEHQNLIIKAQNIFDSEIILSQCLQVWQVPLDMLLKWTALLHYMSQDKFLKKIPYS